MYAITTRRQEELLAHLEKIGVDANGWQTHFVDRKTKEEWVGYFPYSEMQGGGPLYLRSKNVPSDWRTWIDRCLLSSESDDALGLAADIRSLRSERREIVAFLEDRWSFYPLHQRRTFIERLAFPRDSRELLGKHIHDIEKEWREDQEIIARVEVLRKRAEPGATDNPDDAQRKREDH